MRGSNQPNSTSEREARCMLHDHHSRQEKRLTDGWNYVKVVVGSNLRVEIQIKSGHLSWVKKVWDIKEIDIGRYLNEYWASKEHELMVPGRSSPQPVRSYLIERRRGGCRWEI